MVGIFHYCINSTPSLPALLSFFIMSSFLSCSRPPFSPFPACQSLSGAFNLPDLREALLLFIIKLYNFTLTAV